jgi:hypothetical protein
MTHGKTNLIDLTVTLIHETEKAWLVNDGTRKTWVPKSWGELEKNPDGKSYTLTITEERAIEKELI